ncbi:hypothetical protein C2S51_002707 [Perilla frutescens var. frutescens]|nr:hypothetical protein C2S51_002707 [Perilla frutescens var. frutescens]
MLSHPCSSGVGGPNSILQSEWQNSRKETTSGLWGNATRKMTPIAVNNGNSTPLTNALLPFLEALMQFSPLAASRREETEAAYESVAISTTPMMTHQLASLSTIDGESRCLNNITISANGQSVVDECDSTMGWDDEHDCQPPCPNNIVDGSKAVWIELGVPEGDWGELDISWSDAYFS